jgi:hypothetical protein
VAATHEFGQPQIMRAFIEYCIQLAPPYGLDHTVRLLVECDPTTAKLARVRLPPLYQAWSTAHLIAGIVHDRLFLGV